MQNQYSMKRTNILSTLLFVWIFAIFTPSVITLFNNDGNSVFTTNLTEEEQPEQGKNNIDEKLILESNTSDFSMLAHLQSLGLYDFYILGLYDLTPDIVLPPPEQSI